ncbi:MAG: glycosyltransferase [Muribaculaceae bacterium]|nr:glycosyltransferase [Muribaculaceae bacterium]
MELSIVIVNYRVRYFLEQTLRSVQEAVQGLTVEVIVIDNASGDGSLEYVRERFPQYVYVENRENVGFSRANNLGIRMARGEYTLILNPDTIICRQVIDDCLAWMRGHERCAAIGAHMVDGNGVFLPESKRAFPTPWVSFCKIFGLSAMFPRSRWFAKYHLRFLPEDKPHRVDILSGAFMFCRTAPLQQAGGFDEDFFMYGEDIDLSYRLVQAGGENWYVPTTMIHYKGESTKKDTMRYVRVFYDAMLIFYRKHFPRARWVLYPIIKLGVGVRAAMAMAKRLAQKPLRALRKPRTLGDDGNPWVILGDNAVAVSLATGHNHYKTRIPQLGACHVLLDDSSFTYAQIIDFIARNSRDGVEFHIYSSRNGIIISPKMQQS